MSKAWPRPLNATTSEDAVPADFLRQCTSWSDLVLAPSSRSTFVLPKLALALQVDGTAARSAAEAQDIRNVLVTAASSLVEHRIKCAMGLDQLKRATLLQQHLEGQLEEAEQQQQQQQQQSTLPPVIIAGGGGSGGGAGVTGRGPRSRSPPPTGPGKQGGASPGAGKRLTGWNASTSMPKMGPPPAVYPLRRKTSFVIPPPATVHRLKQLQSSQQRRLLQEGARSVGVGVDTAVNRNSPPPGNDGAGVGEEGDDDKEDQDSHGGGAAAGNRRSDIRQAGKGSDDDDDGDNDDDDDDNETIAGKSDLAASRSAPAFAPYERNTLCIFEDSLASVAPDVLLSSSTSSFPEQSPPSSPPLLPAALKKKPNSPAGAAAGAAASATSRESTSAAAATAIGGGGGGDGVGGRGSVALVATKKKASVVGRFKRLHRDYQDLLAHEQRVKAVVDRRLRPEFRRMQQVTDERTRLWATVISAASAANVLGGKLAGRRLARDDSHHHHRFARLIQRNWRSAFFVRTFKKVARVNKALRVFALVAVFKVRCMRRVRMAQTLRGFMTAVRAVRGRRLLSIIKHYRWYVVKCQRWVRQFLQCKQARIAVLLRYWDRTALTRAVELKRMLRIEKPNTDHLYDIKELQPALLRSHQGRKRLTRTTAVASKDVTVLVEELVHRERRRHNHRRHHPPSHHHHRHHHHDYSHRHHHGSSSSGEDYSGDDDDHYYHHHDGAHDGGRGASPVTSDTDTDGGRSSNASGMTAEKDEKERTAKEAAVTAAKRRAQDKLKAARRAARAAAGGGSKSRRTRKSKAVGPAVDGESSRMRAGSADHHHSSRGSSDNDEDDNGDDDTHDDARDVGSDDSGDDGSPRSIAVVRIGGVVNGAAGGSRTKQQKRGSTGQKRGGGGRGSRDKAGDTSSGPTSGAGATPENSSSSSSSSSAAAKSPTVSFKSKLHTRLEALQDEKKAAADEESHNNKSHHHKKPGGTGGGPIGAAALSSVARMFEQTSSKANKAATSSSGGGGAGNASGGGFSGDGGSDLSGSGGGTGHHSGPGPANDMNSTDCALDIKMSLIIDFLNRLRRQYITEMLERRSASRFFVDEARLLLQDTQRFSELMERKNPKWPAFLMLSRVSPDDMLNLVTKGFRQTARRKETAIKTHNKRDLRKRQRRYDRKLWHLQWQHREQMRKLQERHGSNFARVAMGGQHGDAEATTKGRGGGPKKRKGQRRRQPHTIYDAGASAANKNRGGGATGATDRLHRTTSLPQLQRRDKVKMAKEARRVHSKARAIRQLWQESASAALARKEDAVGTGQGQLSRLPSVLTQAFAMQGGGSSGGNGGGGGRRRNEML